MLKLAIILAAVTVACHGSTIPETNTYWLYTKSNIVIPQRMEANEPASEGDPVIVPAQFNADDKTIMVVHGHGGSGTTTLNPLVKDSILMYNSESFNVIVVDWAREAGNSYSSAVQSVPTVAVNLATFIEWLASNDLVNLDELHLVGFGLGAHVVGIAGRTLIAESVGQVARITGLDPSGNQWTSSSSGRLGRDDAKYVEVIHTDGRGLFANGIGIDSGDIDFYANGGSSQPGCLTSSCCHNRAFELFAASMINQDLVGQPCTSTTLLNLNLCRGLPLKMGGTELEKFGYTRIYRVNTGRRFPF